MKKTLTTAAFLTALMISSQMILPTPAFAAETHEQAVEEFSRNKFNIPDELETMLLKTAVWNGKTALQENTCYFVSKKLVLSRSVTLPEGSMLVIRSGGQLRVGEHGRLTVNGAAVVQSGAILNTCSGGKVIIKDSGAAIVNGKLAVSKNSAVESSGYIQGGDSAQINVKGTLSISGELVSRAAPKIYSSAAVKGRDKIELIGEDTRQRYYVEEVTRYNGTMMCEAWGEKFEISPELKQQIIDNLESVLYQYSGEIVVPDFQKEHLEEYSTDLGDSGTLTFYFGNTESQILFPEKFHAKFTFTDTIEGCFYSRILGKENPDILKELGELKDQAYEQRQI